MSIKDKILESKAKRAEKKLEDKKVQTKKMIEDSKKLQKIETESEILDRTKQRLDRRKFNAAVAKTKAGLETDEENIIIKMIGISKDINQLQQKNRNVSKEKARFKNCYYTLLIIRRAMERLKNIEDDYELNETMHDISKHFKMMDQISKGYEPLKKLVFRYRVDKLKRANKYEVDRIKGYYGDEIDEVINDDSIAQAADMDLIDLMVNDTIYDVLLENCTPEAVRECADNNIGVNFEPDDVEGMKKESMNKSDLVDEIDISDDDSMDMEACRKFCDML